MSELKVGKKYRVVKKIGAGSFGDIYLGINDSTKEEVGECWRREASAFGADVSKRTVPTASHCRFSSSDRRLCVLFAAMKLESTKSKHPQLIYEAKLYRILQGAVGKRFGRFVQLPTSSPTPRIALVLVISCSASVHM
jgi:serine/threonine protein kinase